MSTRRVPPLRICPSCGGQHRAWPEHDPCGRCRSDVLEQRDGLAALAAERREARRQERLDGLEGRPDPVPYNEFPEGY